MILHVSEQLKNKRHVIVREVLDFNVNGQVVLTTGREEVGFAQILEDFGVQ